MVSASQGFGGNGGHPPTGCSDRRDASVGCRNGKKLRGRDIVVSHPPKPAAGGPVMGKATRVGYHSITWGGVVGDATGVTSVKDLYYRANGSMEQAFTDIAAAGYAGTEMFDGNLVPYADRPDELCAQLAQAGLELVSVYTGANFIYDEILPEELHRIRRAAELAAAVGAQRLVVGGGARRATGTRDTDYERLAAALDRVTDIAEEHGLTASYHPHLTTIVESPDELARLLPRTRIGFCPDTAHLAAGGGDPAALIRRYPDRIRHVHLKDLRLDP